MKKLLVIGSILFSSLVAANGNADQNQLKKGLDSLTQQAKDLNLSLAQYKHAIDQFYRLDFGDINDVKRLEEYTDIKQASTLMYQDQELGSELTKKIHSIMKSQNKEYAKALGIPESKVREFIEYVKNIEANTNTGNVISSDAKKSGVLTQVTTYGLFGDQPEVVTVTCNLACQAQIANDAYYTALYFREWATQAGVGQYETFHVDYKVGGSIPESGSVEAWRYNNFSGAWKVGTISTCGDVVCKK